MATVFPIKYILLGSQFFLREGGHFSSTYKANFQLYEQGYPTCFNPLFVEGITDLRLLIHIRDLEFHSAMDRM